MNKAFALAGGALAVAVAGAASATTLNFDTLPSGVVAPGTYSAQGVTINPTGYNAEANIGFVPGLNNDICGQGPSCYNNGYYPTQQQITFDFSNAVEGVSFVFNNQGFNGRTIYSAYGPGGLISSGDISSVEGDLVSVSGSGITSLVIDNQGNDWIYNIESLSFSGAPEPTAWALMLIGVGGLGVSLRARRKASLAA